MTSRLQESEFEAVQVMLRCSACGASCGRKSAKFCPICGKTLGEEYQPLDSFRSSFRLQGMSFLVENSQGEEIRDLFEINKNSASEMAWACFVYSLVPYLGILFVPVTFILGTLGIGVSVRNPRLGGGKLALISIGLSFLVLGIQILLWWLLYKIPEMGLPI